MNFDILGFRGQSEMPEMALLAHWVSRASGLGQKGWRVPMRTSPKDLFFPPPPRNTKIPDCPDRFQSQVFTVVVGPGSWES